MNKHFSTLFIINLYIFSCTAGVRFSSSNNDSVSRDTSSYKVNQYITGECSYYGPKFHGRKTANGERFDMYKFSAAHKKLPFGTLLEVENLSNGKKVTVRINDRGPYKKGRILDLSYAAARQIGLDKMGVTKIKAKIIKLGH